MGTFLIISCLNYSSIGTDRTIGKIDFGDIATRTPASKTRIGLGLGVGADFILEVSDNDADWTQVSLVHKSSNVSNVVDFFQTGAQQDFRYLRMRTVVDGGSNSGTIVNVFELYDNDVFGGTASLSFQIKDKNSGNFFTAIPSSEFGTILSGGSVVAQIGDTGDKLYTLPSTQTDCRARFIVSGSLTLGVSIQKVS